jgi:teichuronic acid biosynthesis glycosyltransferase TuaG
MSAAPTVSIILPVYNGERFIAAAIESVRQQSLADWELLIVDDGSTDGTAALVQAQAADPRLTIIQQPNQGPAPARNRAIARATAPYVAFLDADDVWFPGYLEAVTTTLASHPEAVLAFTGWQHIDVAGCPRAW